MTERAWAFYRGAHYPPESDVLFAHGSVYAFAYGESIGLFHATRGVFAEVSTLDAAMMLARAVTLLEGAYLGDTSPHHREMEQCIEDSALAVLKFYNSRQAREKKG